MFLDNEEHMEGEVDNFNVIYSDVITFIAALFILLFSLTYSDSTGSSSLEVLSLSKKQEQQQEQRIERKVEVDELLEKQLSQFITHSVMQQRIKIQLNDPILFKTNSATLNKRSKLILKHVAQLLAQVKGTVVVQGESSKAEASQKMSLSYKRAKAVCDYLIDSNLMASDQLIIQNPLQEKETLLPAYMKQRVQLYVLRVKSK